VPACSIDEEVALPRTDHGARSVGTTVADVMVRRPKTLPATASVDEALAAFEDDHVHLLLLVDGRRLAGTLTRADLPTLAGAVVGHAVTFATLAGRTVTPTTGAERAAAQMAAAGVRRLAVVESDDRLLGLLCLKRSGRGFCSDDDVAARRNGTHSSGGAGEPSPC
jgi:CBS domain-containing protein